MEKVTNVNNLPEEVVAAIMKDRYTDPNEKSFEYSASTLIAPIQQTTLLRRYPEKRIVRDVIDYFWAFIGSIAHQVLEEAWHERMGSVVERRLYMEVEGRVLSGKSDCYAGQMIRDYKTTKVYKVMKGNYADWEKQLNIYAELHDENNLEVNSLLVIAFILNWEKHNTYKKGYPKAPVVQIPLRLWPKEMRRAYITERVKELEQAATMTDEELADTYPCSREEMWQDVKDICIWKAGGNRAVRVFDTEEEARKYLAKHYSGLPEYSIITRYTDRKRCKEHCDIAHICMQNKQLTKAEGGKIEQKGEKQRPLF